MSREVTNILELIREGEESAVMINELFFNSGFEFLACNKEYNTYDGIIGEIDGIWAFENTILLIEATLQSNNITNKIERFFGVWADNQNLNSIKNEFDRRNARIIRIFFDLAHTSDINLPSRQHILRNPANNLLNRTDFTHFSNQEKIIGDLVKFDILNLLNIEKSVQRIEIPVIKVLLKNTTALIFSLPVEQLLEICYVKRRKDEKGYQRILNNTKIGKIRKVIKEGTTITFPNSIIVTPSDVPIRIIDDVEDEYQIVRNIILPASFCSLRVIDGQHRLLGFSKLEPHEIRNHHLVVVALLDIESETEVTTFIQINSTQKRMDPNLLLNLKADFDYNENHPFYFDKKAVEVARKLDENSTLANKIFFGEIVDPEIRRQQTVYLKTLVTALKNNKIIHKKPIFTEDNATVDELFTIIRDFLILLVHQNSICVRLITDNRGIRLFFRLLQVVKRNILKGNIPISIERFIQDLKNIMNQDIFDEIMQNYGDGGLLLSTGYVIDALKETYDDYENLITDLREV